MKEIEKQHSDLGLFIRQASATTAAVAIVTHPLALLANRRQAGASPLANPFSALPCYRGGSPFAYGLFATRTLWASPAFKTFVQQHCMQFGFNLRTSLQKNLPLASRDPIRESVDQHTAKHGQSSEMVSSFVTGTAVAVLDTAISQYNYNARTVNQFKRVMLIGTKCRLKFARMGVLTNLLRNLSMAEFYLFIPLLAKSIKQQTGLSDQASTALATSSAAVAAGTATNGFQVINKTRLRIWAESIRPQKQCYRLPRSGVRITQMLLARDGWQVLFRGNTSSCLMMLAAFGAVKAVEQHFAAPTTHARR